MKYGINTTSDETVIDSIEKEQLTESNGSRIATFMAASAGEAPMANSTKVTPKCDVDAVVFSIQFYGKTLGEVGLMDQDLAKLDWKKFKSYLFQNLLSMNHQENICVSYNDDEGDKLPIESEEEYREALKIAKKKAEAHDKMVLDITRQGGLPTMLSFVSSGIKRVSSSPPKEGGISFFKASSPPKDSQGFVAKAVGSERKLFPGFFSPDRGPIPGLVQGVLVYDCDEALVCDKHLVTATTPTTKNATPATIFLPHTQCRKRLPVQELQNSSSNLLFKFDESCNTIKTQPLDTTTSEDVFGAGGGQLPGGGARPRVTQKQRCITELPPEWFTSYMTKFRVELREELSQQVAMKVTEILKDVKNISSTYADEHSAESLNNQTLQFHFDDNGTQIASHQIFPVKEAVDKQLPVIANPVRAYLDSTCSKSILKPKEKEKLEDIQSNMKASDETRIQIMKEKIEGADTGAKRKKLAKEEEKLIKKQERLDERLTKKQEKLEERLTKKQEKVEERFLKKQEKLAERIFKQQEKVERKKLTSKFPDEMDKASRTQEKVLAKMEGLRKKQSCSPEELNKLRKMVDKHHRVITTEHRQQRRNERKNGNWKAGKSKKISIDNKGFPVDASFLHAALQELEALAEDSPSEGNGGAATRGYDALYLKDITYPDGSEVAPGKEFVKTWRVINSGVMPWNDKTTLCKWTQVRFRGSPAGWKLKPSLKKVACPPLEPAQEGDISITFTAPKEPGWYATHWRFCQRGRVFGNQMWCAIHVAEDPGSDRLQHKSPDDAMKEQRIEVLQDAEKSFAALTLDSQEIQDLSSTTTDDQILHGGPTEADYTEIFSGLPCEPCIRQREEPCHSDNPSGADLEVGIIENYYDTEDTAQKDLSMSLQCLTLSCPDVVSDAVDTKRIEQDLISFEEEAEVLSSGASTPEIIHCAPQAHAVIPLKEMAKESVESLRECVIGKDEQGETRPQYGHTDIPKTLQSDALSISSGSFSELDSEDQAILNESDTELSDHEYYVVNLPECFNLTTSYREADRPDSPDFLTADEDDRTTAVASESQDDQRECLTDSGGASASSNASQEGSHSRTIIEVFPTRNSTTHDCKFRSQIETSGYLELESNKTPMPHPPTETKPFMEIPTEALRTNLTYTVQQVSAGNTDHDDQLQEEEQNKTTWVSGSEDMQGVVCEQPSSAQHKELGHTSRIRDSGESGEGQGAATDQIPESRELPVDLVGALPDELVSIIPEDLVRGVWNTARTFITRINQEMLSPSADTAGQLYSPDDDPASESNCPQPEVNLEHEEAVQESNPSPQNERPPLLPPMQQLEDMGFTNHEVNQRLLTKYNNDVSRAVAELIVLNAQ